LISKVEAAVRFAAELGYAVTVISDAIASYSDREMHAALESTCRTAPVPL